MPLSNINSNSFSPTANIALGGTSTALSRLTVLNTTSSNVSAAAGSRGPIASFRGGNDNNRFDVHVDNSGPRCNVSLSAWNVAGATSQLIFNAGAVGASEAMRIDTAGVVVLTNGQLRFPATQLASADANTLDDYEEGTWTPIIKGTSTNPSYTTSGASGNYVKIGKMVYVSFLLIVTGVSSQGTGNIYLDALPFTVSDQSYASTLTVMYNDAWDVDFRAMYASGISWTMRPIGVTQGNATWGASSALSTGYFSGSGCYLTT